MQFVEHLLKVFLQVFEGDEDDVEKITPIEMFHEQNETEILDNNNSNFTNT